MKNVNFFSVKGLSALFALVMTLCFFFGCAEGSNFTGCEDCDQPNKKDGEPTRTVVLEETPNNDGSTIVARDTTKYPNSTCEKNAMGQASTTSTAKWDGGTWILDNLNFVEKVDKAGQIRFVYSDKYTVYDNYENKTYQVFACEVHNVYAGWDSHTYPGLMNRPYAVLKDTTISGKIYEIRLYDDQVTNNHVWKPAYNAIHNHPVRIAIPKGIDNYEWKNCKIECGNASVELFKNGELVKAYPSIWSYGINYTATTVPSVSNFTLSNINYGSGSTFTTTGAWSENEGVQTRTKTGSNVISFMLGGSSQTMLVNPFAEDVRVAVSGAEIFELVNVESYSLTNQKLVVENATANSATVVYSATMTVKLKGGKTCSMQVTACQPFVKTGNEIERYEWKDGSIDCGTASVKRVAIYTNGSSVEVENYSTSWSYNASYAAFAAPTVNNFTLSSVSYGTQRGDFGNASWRSGNGIQKGSKSSSYTANYTIGGSNQNMTLALSTEDVRAYVDANNIYSFATVTGWEIISPSFNVTNVTATSANVVLTATLKVTLSNGKTCSKQISASQPFTKVGEEIHRYEWRNSNIECGNAAVKRFAIYTNGSETEVSNHTTSWNYNGTYSASSAPTVANFTLSNVSFGTTSGSFGSASWSGNGIQKGSKSASYTATYSIGGSNRNMNLALSAEDVRVYLDASNIHNFATITGWEIVSPSLSVANATATSANVVFTATLKVNLSNGKSCSKSITATQPFVKNNEETFTYSWENASRDCSGGKIDLYKTGSINGKSFVRNISLNLPMSASNNYNQSAQSINSWNNGVVSITNSSVNLGAGNWNGATNNRTGVVTFTTSLGVTVTDNIQVTDGRGVASEITTYGAIPTTTSVTVLSSSAVVSNSNNSATGYDVRKVSVTYSLRVTFSNGTTCTINGVAARDGKVVENEAPTNFGKAIGSITFGSTAKMSGESTIGIYSEGGTQLGIIAHVAGSRVGRWSASEVDMSKVNTVVRVGGTGAYVPAYTTIVNGVVYWFSALKGANPAQAVHSLQWGMMTNEGFFKGTDTSSYTYDVQADGIHTTVLYQKTENNKTVNKSFDDVLPLKF